MWQTKRKIKKEKIQITKKYFLYGGALFVTIILVYLGIKNIADIIQKPLFLSPVPLQAAKTGKQLQVKKDTQKEALINLLAKNNILVASLSAQNMYFHLHLVSGEEILFSREKPLDEQVSSLQLILSRLTIEGKKLQSLDFRFDKPVVLFR